MATKEAKLQIVIDAQNRSQGTFNALKDNLDGVKKSYAGLQGALTAVGSAGVVALGGLTLLTKGVIQAGANFEQTQIAFETMLGSAEQGQKTLKELSVFASRTPFELPQLETASKQLLAYGTTADELIPILKMLGNISAGVGMDKMPQLVMAFGQVKAATKLTGMELRQFSEAGVPLLGTLAAQFGVTASVMQQMISDGKVGFKDVEKALGSLTGEGGKFFNLMDKQSQSLGGQWSNLKDQVSLTARAIGTELLPYLKPLVEQLIAISQQVGAWVKENPQLAATILIAAIALAALLAVILPIAIALPGLIMMFGFLGAAFGVVIAMSAPLLLVIGAIITALVLLTANGYLTKTAWQDVWLGIKVVAAESANAVISTVESMINFIIDGVNKAIAAINRVIAAAQKVPGIGSRLPTISLLKNVDLQQIDTGTIAANDLAGRANPVGKSTNLIQMAGNVFLSQSVAEQIGDLIMGKLKLSSPI